MLTINFLHVHMRTSLILWTFSHRSRYIYIFPTLNSSSESRSVYILITVLRASISLLVDALFNNKSNYICNFSSFTVYLACWLAHDFQYFTYSYNVLTGDFLWTFLKWKCVYAVWFLFADFWKADSRLCARFTSGLRQWSYIKRYSLLSGTTR